MERDDSRPNEPNKTFQGAEGERVRERERERETETETETDRETDRERRRERETERFDSHKKMCVCVMTGVRSAG